MRISCFVLFFGFLRGRDENLIEQDNAPKTEKQEKSDKGKLGAGF